MDSNELVRLLQQPAVRAAILRILAEGLPPRAIVGTSSQVPLKGFRKTSEPTYWWEKEG